MSATNRGAERKAYDFYATPTDVVLNFLEKQNISKLKGNGGNIRTFSSNGNIIKALNTYCKDKRIEACEIRQEEEMGLKEISNEVIIGDFLELDIDKKYDVIIGNPPYSLAKEFVEKSLNCLKDDGVLIFLLRTAFLESKSRYEFWQKNPLSGLYTLSKRPSFTGKGTDATSYSWFVWDKGSDKQTIKVI